MYFLLIDAFNGVLKSFIQYGSFTFPEAPELIESASSGDRLNSLLGEYLPFIFRGFLNAFISESPLGSIVVFL